MMSSLYTKNSNTTGGIDKYGTDHIPVAIRKESKKLPATNHNNHVLINPAPLKKLFKEIDLTLNTQTCNHSFLGTNIASMKIGMTMISPSFH